VSVCVCVRLCLCAAYMSVCLMAAQWYVCVCVFVAA
jgi:hypothetical protein